MTTSISTLVKILATITGIYCALMVGEGQRATQTLNSSRYHYPLCWNFFEKKVIMALLSNKMLFSGLQAFWLKPFEKVLLKLLDKDHILW